MDSNETLKFASLYSFLYLEKKNTLTKNTELACFSIRHYQSESFTTTDMSCETCANQEGKLFKEDTGTEEN